MTTVILVIAALLCFLVGTVNVQPPGTRQINWVSAGLVLLMLAYLVRQ
jgi:hypothetical protein